MCYAMLALAVDLIWGYCGILSLGHAAFFSLGGYAMGMYLMRQIGPRGVYGDPILPDFMVFLNWKSLPWFWYGFNHFWFALLDDGACAGAARPGVRMVCVSVARHGSLFFDHHSGAQLCTHARVLPQRHGIRRQQRIHRFQRYPRVSICIPITPASCCLSSLPSRSAASYLACRAIVGSRAGRVLRAIRDAESRTRFLGYPVESFKLWVFVFSAIIAGVAGALYVPQIGIINPSEFAPINSIEDRHLGRGRRPRHAFRRSRRRSAGELCKDIFDGCFSGSMALRARSFVCPGDVVSASRSRRASSERGKRKMTSLFKTRFSISKS